MALGAGRAVLLYPGGSDRVWTYPLAPGKALEVRTLLSSGNDNHVRLWDAATGRQLWEASDQWDWVYGVNSIALSPDGKTLAVAGNSNEVG